VANTSLSRRFDEAPPELRAALPEDVDGTVAALATPGPVADFTREALHAASHSVFVGIAVATALVAVAIAIVPRRAEPLVFEEDRR
jgi:hypothetical protein